MNGERLPVYILTGFLGSGKTTLLGRILTDPAFADSAVIINELGEVGLDQELVTLSEDSTVVMPGGCACCTIRDDIERALRQLFDARDAGRIPPFRRLFIETTGIANPLPLLVTLNANPLAASRLEAPRVITIVDGILGRETLERQVEAGAQVAAADLVLVSKKDLQPETHVPSAIAAMNPWAAVRRADLLTDPVDALLAMPAGQRLGRFAFQAATTADSPHGGIRSYCLVLDEALDWTAFGIWMSMLLHRHGERVLRVKAILNIDGNKGPVVFHSAQHLVHPLQHLDEWPGTEHRSRIVFILRDLEPELIDRSLKLFDSAAKLSHREAGRGGYLAAGAGGTIAGRPVRRPTAPRWLKG